MNMLQEKSVSNKIGIVAPFKDYNYGTVLQAYALSYSFKKLGIDSEYIHYIPFDGSESLVFKALLCLRHPSIIFDKFFRKHKTNPITTFFTTSSFEPIKKEYDKFVSIIPVSEKVYYRDLKRISNDYASFCVGSDQTWSPFIVDTLSINLLPFVADSKKKNSYAPSLGTTVLPKSYKRKLKKYLSSFNVLSCRDYYGTELLKDILGRNIDNVLDPTLLLNENDWSSLYEPIETPDKYVLCYQLGVKQEILNFVRNLCKRRNLSCVVVPTNEYTSSQPESIKKLSPGQFLYLIKNASYVVTDSFHGTIFSINFQVQFFSFSKVAGGLNTFDNIRIVEILESFGILNRFIENNTESIPANIDYALLEKQLQERREKSQLVLACIANTI